MYYITKVEISAQIDTDKGVKEKTIKEQYLVQANSVTDAEAKMMEELKNSTEFEFDVVSVTTSKIIKVI